MSPADDEDEDEGAQGAKPKGDVSEKQVNFILSLQKRIGLDDDALGEVLRDVAGAESIDDLSRKEASDVIDELQVKAREKGIDLDAQPKASEKQVGFMRSLKRRAHMTDDEFAAFLEERAGVTEPEEVGKRDASKVIDDLLALEKEKGAGGGAAKKAPAKKTGGGEKKAPAKKKVLDGSRPATGKGKKPEPVAGLDDEDDGAPPPKAPPADDDDAPEPGAHDGPDDEDLDRDPGDAGDDDLPF